MLDGDSKALIIVFIDPTWRCVGSYSFVVTTNMQLVTAAAKHDVLTMCGINRGYECMVEKITTGLHLKYSS
ncbi:hypothetical protein AC249_AIPGENE9158 [Exaiptasia diaphana]|nr:hypothetical protein AC249_AIPGENE9158 [Exaiptasia diaphana]